MFVNIANETTIEATSGIEPENIVVHRLPFLPAGLRPRQDAFFELGSRVCVVPICNPSGRWLENVSIEVCHGVRVEGITEVCECFLTSKCSLLEDCRPVNEVLEVSLDSCSDAEHQEGEANNLRFVVLRFPLTCFLKLSRLDRAHSFHHFD